MCKNSVLHWSKGESGKMRSCAQNQNMNKQTNKLKNKTKQLKKKTMKFNHAFNKHLVFLVIFYCIKFVSGAARNLFTSKIEK